MRKTLSRNALLALLLLVVSLAMTNGVMAQNETKLYVDPSTSTGLVGDIFSIDVVIANVANLYGFEFKLGYDTSVLDILNVSIQPFLNEPVFLSKDETNEDLGRYWLAISSTAPAEPKTGSGTLVTITFEVTADGTSVLDLYDTKLADPNAEPIPHEEIDGNFIAGVHDVAVTDMTAYPHHVIRGELIYINVTVENQGAFTETFDVTVYADTDTAVVGDEITIGVQTVYDLPAGASKILPFVWDTIDVPYGHYWLSAEASVVPGETDTADNLLVGAVWIGGIIPSPREQWIMQTLVPSILSVFLTAFLGISAIVFFRTMTLIRLPLHLSKPFNSKTPQK